MSPDTAAPPDGASSKAQSLGGLLRQAVAHDSAGRQADAERLLTGVLGLDPLHAEALHRLGDLRTRQGRYEEALALVNRAIAQRPDAAVFHRTAAETLRLLARYDEAMLAADRAVALDPRDHMALVIRGAIHHDRQVFAEAFADTSQALALQPDYPEAHLRLGELLLMRGDYAAGWAHYAWNDRIAAAQPVLPPDRRLAAAPQWDGTRLPDGTLLLVTDQGYGDAIQFARYIPWAGQMCRQLALACDPSLLALLAPLHPGMLAFHQWERVPDFAAWCALSSLPRLHRTTLTTIPATIPYIAADPRAVAAWQDRLVRLCPPGARRVGLVWAGRPTHPNDRNRSASLAALAPITACDGVILVSLQQDPARAEIAHAIAQGRSRAPLLDIGHLLRSFSDTAAVIATLDMVISVDSAVAHLAAAMGKPVWIMLPYVPDWRWLLRREDSPWYPTVRLFRQPAPRAWHDVAVAVARALGSPPA